MNRLFVLIITSLLWLPTLDVFVDFLPEPVLGEKRKLALAPEFGSISNPIKLAKDTDTFYKDHFGGRSWLILANTQINLKLLGLSPIPQIVVGRDGWLFYKSEANENAPGINDFQGLVILEEAEIEQFNNNVSTLSSMAHAIGAEVVVLIAPNKQTIYGEFLPKKYQFQAGPSRFDQFLGGLATDQPKQMLDVRPVLVAGKDHAPVYFKTDTHWNSYGAYLVSQAILQQAKRVESIDFQVTLEHQTDYLGDLAEMLATTAINDTNYTPQLSQDDEATQIDSELAFQDRFTSIKSGKLLFFGDSYSRSLIPYLSKEFGESVFIYITPDYQIESELITIEQPDLIVIELAERFLHKLNVSNR